ncbi:nicotinamide riboside kinase 2 [Dermochelys coriacea]|uniref:nicotinamide riboside kinase 2 n=1 Tax=Dermochelys coriacea TaxID=27794 RepID=UPI0018E8A201|nr:nicotinamide riboside kinase 2 [Dermochelys coriacea]
MISRRHHAGESSRRFTTVYTCVTNGGKTTLTNRLIKALPNCCVVHQDDFYKPQDQIEVREDNFKQWDGKSNGRCRKQPLIDLFKKRYYLTVPCDQCKRRRRTQHYPIPGPPGLFNGHVWPMHLKYRKEMETHEVDVVYLDRLKFRYELDNQVFEEIQNMLLNCS